VSVTYTRAAGPVLTLTAVPGLTTFTSEQLPGRIEIANRDYLVAVADLMVSGVETPPALGDRIAETVNGVTCTFEVMTPDTGEPAWRYSSQWRAMYRVHCKRVS
jgi:hypothetical protein